MNKKILLMLSILILGVISVSSYLNYRTHIPDDNYITISMCGFGCDNNMLFDLSANEVRVYYAFYNRKNILSNKKLTPKEVNKIRKIFNSREYFELPEFNGKVALDAESISVKSSLQGMSKNFNHIMPEDKTVREIIKLYNDYNVTD